MSCVQGMVAIISVLSHGGVRVCVWVCEVCVVVGLFSESGPPGLLNVCWVKGGVYGVLSITCLAGENE